MQKIALELDAVNGTELVGNEIDCGHGFVDVALVKETGPAGHPLVEVTGSAPAVLGWMLNTYDPDYESVIDLMRRAELVN